MRSASNSWQMSRETSRMISSTLLVEWIRLVTACSFLEKASFTLMSATLPRRRDLGSRTALMVVTCSKLPLRYSENSWLFSSIRGRQRPAASLTSLIVSAPSPGLRCVM